VLARALKEPLGPKGEPGGRGLSEFLSGGRSVLVIVNDATRPTPTELMLDAVMDASEGRLVSIIVATGAHRGPTEEEYRRILGKHYAALRPRTSAHDSRDAASLETIGTTRNGTPIALNKAVFAHDRILVTGSVEPHYFAGFTGGRKAFLPGVAGFATIEANHRQALDPRAAALALEGNPVHEDMVDALSLIRAPIFSLMAVLDGEQRVAAATAGDIDGAFRAATEMARSIFCVAVPRKASVVLSVARFPMDIDLYQSQKAIDNGALALADGGTLILVSACREGLGDRAYAELLASARSPGDAIEAIRGGYRLGYHKAAKMAQVAQRASILAKTELDGTLLRSMFIEPVVDLQEAVDAALARSVPDAARGLIVLPDGCLTVPSPAR
jgi:nickel-dependent lactate racemase